MACISLPTAVLVAGGLSAGSSLIAGQTQANAANNAAGNTMAMFQQTQRNLAPYMQAGLGGIQGVQELLGIGPAAGSAANPNQTGAGPSPGMLAAQAAGTHSHGLGSANLVWGIHDPFGKGASPIQDIAGALQAGKPVTDAQWASAGFGPGGSSLGQQPGSAVGGPGNPVLGPVLGGPNTSPGTGAGTSIMDRLAQTPGYQFALQQGLQATQSGFAAQGLGQSGPALKGAAQYAEGLASTTYQQQLSNFFNLMSSGQSAAAGLGGLGLQSAGQAGGFSTSGAAASAGGLVGATNALGGGALNYSLLNSLGMFNSPAGPASAGVITPSAYGVYGGFQQSGGG